MADRVPTNRDLGNALIGLVNARQREFWWYRPEGMTAEEAQARAEEAGELLEDILSAREQTRREHS